MKRTMKAAKKDVIIIGVEQPVFRLPLLAINAAEAIF